MVNKVILIGNVGKDPEMKGHDGNIANLSLATSETWYKDGEKNSKTEWHKIVAFGKVAEIVRDYVHKGMRIYIECGRS